jgi:hypothetical protein
MSHRGPRICLFVLGVGLGLAAPARAQELYPGAGYQSAVNSASLVRVLLTDLTPGRRMRAAQLLGAGGDPKAVQALSTAAVEDADPNVRQAATNALAQIRGAVGGGVVLTPAPTTPPAWPPLVPSVPGVPGVPGVVMPPGVVQPPRLVQPPPVVQPPFPPQPPAVPQVPFDPQVEMVQSWYQRYLRRSIDMTGLQGWVSLLRRGASHDDVKANILGSPEYYQLHGNTPEGFVAALYGDVLGRAPNRDELPLWTNRLGQVRNDRPRVASDFLRASNSELHFDPAYGHYVVRSRP